MDGGAWWAAVHEVAGSRTRLSDHFDFSLSCIGEGNGNPLQYSCLENPRDGGAWWAAIYGVAQSRTRLKRLSSSSSSNKQQNNVNQGPCSFHLFTYLVFLALFRALAHSLYGSDILLQLHIIHTHKTIKLQWEAEWSLSPSLSVFASLTHSTSLKYKFIWLKAQLLYKWVLTYIYIYIYLCN